MLLPLWMARPTLLLHDGTMKHIMSPCQMSMQEVFYVSHHYQAHKKEKTIDMFILIPYLSHGIHMSNLQLGKW